MGRGYWLPPNHEALVASDGFYVECDSVYGADIDAGWESFLEVLCRKLKIKENTFQQVCEWKTSGMGQSRFVLVRNRHVDIIAEDSDGYVAVYAIIPENNAAPGFAKRSFPRYLAMLKEILTELYPGAVFKRHNYRDLQKIG